MALGQYNAKPTCAHLLAAKGVLRYLSGTLNYGLEYSISDSSIPMTIREHINGCGLSDADWATDESDRGSISGYRFFMFGSLLLAQSISTER